MKAILPLLFLLASCTSQIATRAPQSQSALEEMRIALLDVRQAYSAQQMELQLLEERIEKLKTTEKPNKVSNDLKNRIRQLEKAQEQIKTDLHAFSTHANQTTKSLIDYRKQINTFNKHLSQQENRLDEIVKLKTTLNSISKAISKQSTPGEALLYKVRPGDSLEKIARNYSTSVSDLMNANNLQSSRIIIGQELTIPQ
ncbi:MAG: Peptidoglycan endopeptidase LytF [Chlamydiae bacterium]|nr:Peptidoglycan endopeptidase LytF [Chlamydiota bacterium]